MGDFFHVLPSLVVVFYVSRNGLNISQNVATIIKELVLAAKTFLAIIEQINQMLESVFTIIQLLKK